jgi:NAD(P)-dependent dehydrogenase (short-subunit alcohol dehydrogenase family)
VTGARFAGRSVIVTGAGSGIGRASARRFASEGADVMLIGRRLEPLEETRALIERDEGRAWSHTGDVGSAADVRAAVDVAREQWEGIDVLHNNAGIVEEGSFLDTAEDSWDRVLGINLKGAFLMAQAVARVMVTARAGAIVHTASIDSFGIDGPYSSYHTSKHGLLGLSRAMAVELGPRGVRVNCVSPGYTHTGLENWSARTLEHLLNDFRRVPLRRMASLEEVAAAVAFLASDDAAAITGTSLAVDCGLMASLHAIETLPLDDSDD